MVLFHLKDFLSKILDKILTNKNIRKKFECHKIKNVKEVLKFIKLGYILKFTFGNNKNIKIIPYRFGKLYGYFNKNEKAK